MFKDYIKIRVKAGNGGNGISSFRREKFIPDGGPDGGDGGVGGDIYFMAKEELSTLANFRTNKLYSAENGEDGGRNNRFGKSGEDLILEVPIGTVVLEDGKQVIDLNEKNKKVKYLKGGKGGFGNARFKSSVRQAPNFSIDGEKTLEKEIILELKTIADVGLVGFPNAGKSTFLSVVTNARPKIAAYPFTTLTPNLGVVSKEDKSFTIADIPGIIEGASEGVGLGHTFLKHIERTKLLLILVDSSAFEIGAVDAAEKLKEELFKYSEVLSKKRSIMVATKIDSKNDEELEKLREYARKENLDFFEISSVTHTGLDKLIFKIFEELEKIKEEEKIEKEELEKQEEYEIYTLEDDKKYKFEIEKIESLEKIKGVLRGEFKDFDKNTKVITYKITGPAVDWLLGRINLTDRESLAYFHGMLKRLGIEAELKRQNIQEGDSIEFGDYHFEWID